MSKLDQLKALGEAKRKARSNPFEDAARGRDPTPTPTPAPAKPKGLRVPALPRVEPIGDGVALTSMAHPPGLIEKMADAIRSGKLSLKRGRPKITEKRPWELQGISRRTWYRRQKAKK